MAVLGPKVGVRRVSPLGLAAVAAMAFVTHGGCSYSPNIESGSLLCSPEGECPRGFTCSTSGLRAGRCVNGSAMPGGQGGTSGTSDGGFTSGGDGKLDLHFEAPAIDLGLPGTGGVSGVGGSGVPSTSAASYIGTWVFGAEAAVHNDCGPDYPMTTGSLAQTTLQIYATSSGPDILGAAWSVWPDCTYELYLDSTGLHINNPDYWYCEDTTEDPSVAWNLDYFDVVTSGGSTATHDAHYYQGYFYADGTMIYCDQQVQASMTKR